MYTNANTDDALAPPAMLSSKTPSHHVHSVRLFLLLRLRALGLGRTPELLGTVLALLACNRRSSVQGLSKHKSITALAV